MKEKITMTKKNLSKEEAFERFIRSCKVKNLTPNSIESYEQKIVHFNQFCDERQLALSDIGSEDVEDFVLWCRENTKANDRTIQS